LQADLSLKKSTPNVLEIQGDLFDCESNVSLVHCVSADFKMSQGIALIMRRKFGKLAQLRRLKKTVTEVASIEADQRTIFYLITKGHYWEKPTYPDVFQSLRNLKKICTERQITQLACPRLGCGLDGLEWETVCSMLHYIFQISAINIKVIVREELSEDDKSRILKEFHNNPLGGYQGMARTYQRISRQYYWKGMRRQIKEYIRTC